MFPVAAAQHEPACGSSGAAPTCGFPPNICVFVSSAHTTPAAALPSFPFQVPCERYLFMKLTYTDETPDEYEPPMFGPAADGGVGCFSRMPFVM